MSRCSHAFATATCIAALAAPAWVAAQVARGFPADALRGEIAFGTPPEVLVNKQAARLAPGSRIRGLDNMLVMSGAIAGSKFTVNYTVDTYGLVKDVWLLRPDEAKKLWPRTRQEAAQWSFDPVAQTWVKP